MNHQGAILLERPPTAAPASPVEVALSVQFDAFAGRLADFERAVLDQLLWERRQPAQPVHHRSVVSVAADASGFAVLDLLGPSQGHAWQILGVAVGGLATTTAAAGRADTFVSKVSYQRLTGLAAVGVADWRDFTTSLPNVALYEANQIYLHGQEHLYVVISGGTAGQAYVAGATIVDLEDGAVVQVTGR